MVLFLLVSVFSISLLFIVYLDRPMFILFCILRFRLCLLYISIGQCLSYSVFYDFVFVYCTSQSANVYLILYSTISSLFISIGQCLSYSVFYDFVFVYCTSQSANVYLILYSTVFCFLFLFSIFLVFFHRSLIILALIFHLS